MKIKINPVKHITTLTTALALCASLQASNCVYDGKEYSEGSVVCQNGYEFLCRGDGTWSGTGAKCDAKNGAVVKQLTSIATNGTVVTLTNAVPTGSNAPLRVLPLPPGTNVPLAILPCCRLFADQFNTVGIRNNCKECKWAVMNWYPNPGIVKYKVPGYSQIIIPHLGQSGELIGENPCD